MNIRVLIPAKCRQDKGSGKWVVYSEECDVLGYGATLPKARAMFVEQVKDVLKPLKKLSHEKGNNNTRLNKMGR